MHLPETHTQAFKAGTLAGAGSFRCEVCGFAVALHELDEIPACPHCGSGRFKRSSIFGDQAETDPFIASGPQHPDWLDEAREALVGSGDHLAWRDDERTHVVALQAGWTRVGRSMAAHIHLDDPTVSRRHALIHCEDSGARVLDDRSLNGLYVNGQRLEWHALEDGDELLIGRYRLYYLRPEKSTADDPGERTGAAVD